MQLGRYRIDATLGEGATGTVYKAFDEQLARSVAIKRIHQHDVREARALAALSHPNVVTVHEVGEDDGQPYLVMELVQGTPLRAFIGDGGIDQATKLAWLYQLARALQAVHQVGLRHRNVKPDSVLIADHGSVKLIGFGLARADGRDDQLAWGVTAYELLALPATVPAEITEVVMRAMREQPGDRFASMAEIEQVLAAWVTARASGPPGRAQRDSAPPVVLDPRAPLRIRDLPLPEGCDPAAREAYRLGLETWATHGSMIARKHFLRAAALEPTLAAARLRVLVSMTWVHVEVATLFHEAYAHAATLTRRDQQLLRALEPIYLLDPADEREARRRLLGFLEEWPNDAEALLVLAVSATSHTEPRAALAAYARVLAVDPTNSDALAIRLQTAAYCGDDEDVRAAEQACRELGATSWTCLYFRAEQVENRGDAAELEQLARGLTRAGRDVFSSHVVLASALASNGKPRAAITEALRRCGALAESRGHNTEVALMHARLAALFGDFAAAQTHLRDAGRMVEDSHSQREHGKLARLVVQLAWEVGDVDRAVASAIEFLDRRDGLDPPSRAEDFALAFDPTPALLRMLGAAGCDREDIQRRRDAWLADWTHRWQMTSSGSFLWLHGYAGTAFDLETASDALSRRAAFEPICRVRPRAMTELDEGRMHMLLGQSEPAEERLRRAATVCRALSYPFEHVHAHDLLGRVLEDKGDVAGARAAYRVVLSRWGGAPRSVTAEHARERLAVLEAT